MVAALEELQACFHADSKALDESIFMLLGFAPKSTTLNVIGAAKDSSLSPKLRMSNVIGSAKAVKLKNIMGSSSSDERRKEVVV